MLVHFDKFLLMSVRYVKYAKSFFKGIKASTNFQKDIVGLISAQLTIINLKPC